VARDEEFRDFVLKRSARLLRAAYALTGDRGYAEDLVQNALLRTYAAWDRVADADDPLAYAQRILFTSFKRMHRRRRVTEALGVPMEQVPSYSGNRSEDRDQMMKALHTLPKRQRAVVVLRYYEDLSVERVAELLGCSAGTVKSQTAKALSKLRISPLLDAPEVRRT
jgi:RNA polymerase sigma-70 factor (sigma-E family)